MEMEKSASTPTVENIKELFPEPVSSEMKHKKGKYFPHRSVTRSWLYLSTHNRPDITFCVAVMGRFVKSPTTTHWVSEKRMRGLRGPQKTRIMIGAVTYTSQMKNGKSSRLPAESSSDWTGYIAARKFTGGYNVQLNGALAAWRLFKPHCVAAKTIEVEYVSLPEFIQMVRYQHHILQELVGLQKSTVIYEDHQPYILWATEQGRLNKHFDGH